jgi:hypothetical protein
MQAHSARANWGRLLRHPSRDDEHEKEMPLPITSIKDSVVPPFTVSVLQHVTFSRRRGGNV